MKNGGKNKSVAFIILFSVYIYIYIYIICNVCNFSPCIHSQKKRHTSCHCIGALLKGINMYRLGTNIHFW